MTAIMKPTKNTASNTPSIITVIRELSASVAKTHRFHKLLLDDSGMT